jgi:hypothetical protein
MNSTNQTYKVWCLSLKSNKDRREWMISIKDKIGLDFEFWDASTPEEITDEVRERYFKYVDFYEWDVIVDAVMATFISHMNILKWSVDNKTNIILIEDDLDYVNHFDCDNIDWSTFDVFKLGELGMNCYSYAVSWEGAEKLLLHYNSIRITQAYDVELHKITHLKYLYLPTPMFIQVQNKFISNLAPNGYKRIAHHNKDKKLL